MKFDVIDNCPVPWAVSPAIHAIKERVKRNHGYVPVLNSAYRGDGAKRLLKRLHKMTQAMLYYGFVHHLRGFLPANPPTMGTHILLSDAVAYRGPRGRPLFKWQCGFDWNDHDIPNILEAARQLGIPMFQPYPTTSEYHHTNFKSRPSKYMRKG